MRWGAGALAVLAAGGIGMQFVAERGMADALGAAARLAGFFTILSNALVAGVMARTALGAGGGASWHGMALVQIVAVATVYHLILARHYHPTGLAWWADAVLHSLVPAGVALFWWRRAPKSGLGARDAALWLLWPLGFCALAMARGAATGWYPYFFLDPAVLGPGGVGAAVLALALLFLALGLGVVRLARQLTSTGV